MAEYDVLPEIAHACGHNIIAAAAAGAGLAMSSIIDKCKGTIRVTGCSAEDSGGSAVNVIPERSELIVSVIGCFMSTSDH